MKIEEILQALGGAARTADALARGATERELALMIESGAIVRVRRGVLALPRTQNDVVEALSAGARLTCISAATHYGLWRVRTPQALHLCGARHSAADQVSHGGRTVPVHPFLPLVGLVDALIHVLQCRPPEESVPMVECTLRRGDTVAGFIASRLPGNRNGPARAAPASVDLTGESPVEVVARLLLRGAGLDVRPQVVISGVGRVDFVVEGFLIEEIDGAAYHSDRQALRRDRQRNNRSVLGGYTVLRFCYEDVMFFPDEVIALVLSVLGRRPVR